MSVIYLVLPLALAIVVAGIAAFVWAARRGQYDDLDTPAVRVVFDDEHVVGHADRDAVRHDVERARGR